MSLSFSRVGATLARLAAMTGLLSGFATQAAVRRAHFSNLAAGVSVVHTLPPVGRPGHSGVPRAKRDARRRRNQLRAKRARKCA